MGPTRIGVISAMREELQALLDVLEPEGRDIHGGRSFHSGRLAGRPVVLVQSGIGKVAAAATTTLLLDRFDVGAVLFTGVAGGLATGVAVGDVVVAEALLQHDMDASPLFPRYQVPLTGRDRFASATALSSALAAGVMAALPGLRERLAAFGLGNGQRGRPVILHRGLIVSGDCFVSSDAASAALRAALPDALAVEMEGAAAAQVCADFGVPIGVLRTISDRADDHAGIDFSRFVAEVASELTREVVLATLPHLP